MLNSLEQTLERIEEKLDELLKRKRAPAKKHKTDAQVHDDAVAASMSRFPLKGDEPATAWCAFCATRYKPRKYLTEPAIKALWKKLDAFPVAEQVRALEDSVANGWSGVFPKETGEVPKDDWFNKEQA